MDLEAGLASDFIRTSFSASRKKLLVVMHGLHTKAEAHINVTLVAKTRVASSGGNITLHTQRMPVGSFQMYGEWPASQHLCEGVAHDSGQSRTADGACQVLRAVRSLCLVVSCGSVTSVLRFPRPAAVMLT